MRSAASAGPGRTCGAGIGGAAALDNRTKVVETGLKPGFYPQKSRFPGEGVPLPGTSLPVCPTEGARAPLTVS